MRLQKVRKPLFHRVRCEFLPLHNLKASCCGELRLKRWLLLLRRLIFILIAVYKSTSSVGSDKNSGSILLHSKTVAGQIWHKASYSAVPYNPDLSPSLETDESVFLSQQQLHHSTFEGNKELGWMWWLQMTHAVQMRFVYKNTSVSGSIRGLNFPWFRGWKVEAHPHVRVLVHQPLVSGSGKFGPGLWYTGEMMNARALSGRRGNSVQMLWKMFALLPGIFSTFPPNSISLLLNKRPGSTVLCFPVCQSPWSCRLDRFAK